MRLAPCIGMALLAGCFGASKLEHETDATPNGRAPWSQANGPQQCAVEVDPGRVTIHRLNRAEYDNTVRDLLGDTTRPAREFPADDRGYGYDNNADVLSLAPLLMEKYESAADRLVDEAWARDHSEAVAIRVEAEAATASTGAAAGTAWNLYSNGTVSASVRFEQSGEHTLSARAWGQQAGPEPTRMVFLIDGQNVATFDVEAVAASPQVYSKAVSVAAGSHTFGVGFINDYLDSSNPDPAQRDRNLFVDWFEVTRPGNSAGANARLRICDPASVGEAACARRIFEALALRAWRRPATPAELDRLMTFTALAASNGDTFDVGVKLGLQAILLSPNFLFRVETDPDPASTTPHPLSDFELASRLSYFLWSSTPDDALLVLAGQGALSNPETLKKQVDRMLENPKSDALIENFAGQWLESRSVSELEKDATLFPNFDPALRTAAQAETELFFRAFLEEDRPARDMLDADFTFLNDRLAAHYGLPPVGSDELKRVSLPESSNRGGLLTQAAFLSLTSQANRNSPVKRGLWVLEHLLCKEPPPPPPGVENLAEPTTPTGTLRERFEQHRTNSACIGCHATMDPIGFGLESYDAIGRFRTEDVGGFAIDASGQLPTGEAFSGAGELSRIIKADPSFSTCLAENLLTYALGRGIHKEDHCAVQQVATSFEAQGGSLKDLIDVVVQSAPFTQRRGEPEGETP